MSIKHLLTCDCGQTVPVEPSQAGGSVNCACGARLEVPTLGQLRQLPQAEAPAAAVTKSEWGLRQGVLALGLIVALGLAGLAGYWRATEPAPPPKFDAQAAEGGVDRHLDQLTPAQGYQRWVTEYQPLKFFTPFKNPREEVLRASISRYRAFSAAALIAAIVAAAASLGIYAGMKPRGR